LDDWPQFVHSIDLKYMMPMKSAEKGMEVFREEFDVAYKYGGLWVSVWHPFASGRLSRWNRVVELLD
jgi:peptidoglycan-N-acetylglucosamine deacetylase